MLTLDRPAGKWLFAQGPPGAKETEMWREVLSKARAAAQPPHAYGSALFFVSETNAPSGPSSEGSVNGG